MTDILPDIDRGRTALAALPAPFHAGPEPRPHGAVRGILFGLAIMLPVYAAVALIALLWA